MIAASVLSPVCSESPEPFREKPIITHPFPPREQLTPGALARHVARKLLVPIAQLSERDRHKTAAAARHVFWWYARKRWGTSYPELGRLLPGRPFDHSSTLNGVRKVEKAVDQEERFRAGMSDQGDPVGAAALAISVELESA